MLQLLWLIPILPLAGFVTLATCGKILSRRAVSAFSVFPAAVSCVIALLIGASFIFSPPAGDAYSQSLGTWFEVSGFNVGFGLYLDSLSLVMATVVTFVGLLILIYSIQFMSEDEGYSRFFAYMNLFIASMLILLLADNFLLMYLGWEGVGLCSYLLIGFWYKEPENCRAAIKAFIVTRIGDTLMAVGLFMFFIKYQTLKIQPIMNEVSQLTTGSAFCTITALLLLGGAIGKSAQLPLQTWLPDAMAGPTPVSALIHAATMVTAGVYLIARTHVLFSMSPVVLKLVALIGAATLLLAAFSAFVQKDIKRILAYSTISQIGYMFLALGAGAWAAAIYHFVTHALFKSSLFLGAGVLIMALKDEHNIFKMGGLRKEFPKTFRAFIAASLTLAAIPPLTITFNSKDLILNTVWASSITHRGLWFAGVIGALLTAAYSFRLLYVVFFGKVKIKPYKKPAAIMIVPLSILAFLAAISGFPELISTFFGVKTFYNFLQTSLPQPVVNSSLPVHESIMQIFYASVSLLGIVVTYIIYCHAGKVIDVLMNTFITSYLYRFVRAGFGFDWLYKQLFVRPYITIARINKNDFLDSITTAGVHTFRYSNLLLTKTVTGNLRWYVACVGIGAVVLLGIVILL
jgi:NADH-quinone oxidoreductase subunit L